MTVNTPLLSRGSMLSLFTEQFQTERVVTIADAFDKLLSNNEIWSDLSVLDKAGLLNRLCH